MTVEWQHKPQRSLVSIAWTVELMGDGALMVTCGAVDEPECHTLRVPHEVVLELANAIRRNEVRLVVAQNRGKEQAR